MITVIGGGKREWLYS